MTVHMEGLCTTAHDPNHIRLTGTEETNVTRKERIQAFSLWMCSACVCTSVGRGCYSTDIEGWEQPRVCPCLSLDCSWICWARWLMTFRASPVSCLPDVDMHSTLSGLTWNLGSHHAFIASTLSNEPYPQTYLSFSTLHVMHLQVGVTNSMVESTSNDTKVKSPGTES